VPEKEYSVNNKVQMLIIFLNKIKCHATFNVIFTSILKEDNNFNPAFVGFKRKYFVNN